MRIAVIGAGRIGGTLGRGWAAAGHIVRFGVRNPQEAKHDALRQHGEVVGVAEALQSTEVALIAIPAVGMEELIHQHAPALNGCIVIDATNNVRGIEMNGLRRLGEAAPNAHLARAFSTLGWENFANPQLGGQQIDLFYCAQPGAQETVDALIAALGLRPVFVGGVEQASALDGMTQVWFALVFGQGRGRRVAFKLLEEH